MTRNRVAFVMLTAALTAVWAVPGAQASRTESVSYLPAVGTFNTADCDPDNGAPMPNAGGACFTPQAGETQISVDVVDDTDIPLAVDITFVGNPVSVVGELISPNPIPGGGPTSVEVLGRVSFCGSAEDVAIPAGTTGIDVLLPGADEAAIDVLDENPCENVALATTGTITVTFD